MIELAHQRHDFCGVIAFDLGSFTLADGGELPTQCRQRCQRQLELNHHGHGQPCRQHAQGGNQHLGKALQRNRQRGRIGGDHQTQGRGIGFRQLNGACHHQQLVAVAIPYAAIGGRCVQRQCGFPDLVGLELRPLQRLIPE